MKTDLRVFLILQLVAMGIALASFRLIEVRWQAALVAGFGFVIIETWMVLKTLRWKTRFRYFSFYFSRINLWLFSLPMLLVRFRYFGVDFSQVHFLGIPGPQFHKWAEMAFVVMVVGTGLDLLKVTLRERKAKVRPA